MFFLVVQPEIKKEIKVQKEPQVQLPKKPLLMFKYPLIMELEKELNHRNKEFFEVEKGRGNLEIELSECTEEFMQKQRKKLQERITLLDKKAEKTRAELSKVIQDAGYVNIAEFYTDLFAVRGEKRKYEAACKEWQEECIREEISNDREAFCNEETARRSEKRHR
jgi:hypothetical protein